VKYMKWQLESLQKPVGRDELARQVGIWKDRYSP